VQRHEQHIRYAEYRKMMEDLALDIPSNQDEADLPQADDIKIGDGVELIQLRFGFPPKGRGGPVFNFRSEGRDFADSKRCLVLGSAFFEFTGKKYPKAKHRFTLADHPMMAIAGLWRETEGNQPPAFTMLTTAPGPDVAPIHGRQIVVLKPERWADWIYLSKTEEELTRPSFEANATSVRCRRRPSRLAADNIG
jgi:putative SOS response-associated peptidase YedK